MGELAIGQNLIEYRDRHDGAAADEHDGEIDPVQEQKHREEHEQERRVDQRGESRTADEVADGIDVAQALARVARLRRQRQHRAQHPRRHSIAHPHADAHQQPQAHRIQRAEHADARYGDNREQRQRLHAAAGQHPVVNLQHVEGRGERQHAHGGREQERHRYDAGIGLQRGADRISRRNFTEIGHGGRPNGSVKQPIVVMLIKR
jgi:hypothetical protein